MLFVCLFICLFHFSIWMARSKVFHRISYLIWFHLSGNNLFEHVFCQLRPISVGLVFLHTERERDRVGGCVCNQWQQLQNNNLLNKSIDRCIFIHNGCFQCFTRFESAFVSKITFISRKTYLFYSRALLFFVAVIFPFCLFCRRPFIALLFLRGTQTHIKTMHKNRNYRRWNLGETQAKRMIIIIYVYWAVSGGMDLIFFPLLAVPFFVFKVCFLWDNIFKLKSIIKASTWRNNLLNFFMKYNAMP